MKKVIAVLMFLSLPALIFSANDNFNWHRYYAKLERISCMRVNIKRFINMLGKKYFNETKDYFLDGEKRNQILKLGIKDEEASVRQFSILSIVKLNNKNLLGSLIARLSAEKNIRVKRFVIWGIGRIGNEDSVLPLTQYLKREKDNSLIGMLALALGRLGGTGDETGPILYLAENKKNLFVKCSAILGIGKLKIKEGIKILKTFLYDSRKEVRYSSILSLSFLVNNDKELNKTVMKIFEKDYSHYVKLSAAFFLLKQTGYNDDYAGFLYRMLNHYYYKYPAIDFIEALRFRKSLIVLDKAFLTGNDKRFKIRIKSAIRYIKGEKYKSN